MSFMRRRGDQDGFDELTGCNEDGFDEEKGCGDDGFDEEKGVLRMVVMTRDMRRNAEGD